LTAPTGRFTDPASITDTADVTFSHRQPLRMIAAVRFNNRVINTTDVGCQTDGIPNVLCENNTINNGSHCLDNEKSNNITHCMCANIADSFENSPKTTSSESTVNLLMIATMIKLTTLTLIATWV